LTDDSSDSVLSELRKGERCDAKVRSWARSTVGERHYISVLSLGEIRKGVELLRRRSPGQCPAFERWLKALKSDYAADILPVTEEIADRWGRMMASRVLPIVDGMLAATAEEFNLTMATRNTGDFTATGVQLVNPFE